MSGSHPGKVLTWPSSWGPVESQEKSMIIMAPGAIASLSCPVPLSLNYPASQSLSYPMSQSLSYPAPQCLSCPTPQSLCCPALQSLTSNPNQLSPQTLCLIPSLILSRPSPPTPSLNFLVPCRLSPLTS